MFAGPSFGAAAAVRPAIVALGCVDFPWCMTKIAHLDPHDIVRRLTLDDCETRTASIDWKGKANVKMHEGAVRNQSTREIREALP